MLHKISKFSLLALLCVGVSVAVIFLVQRVSVPIVEHLMEVDARKQSQLWHRRVILHLDDPTRVFEENTLSPTDVKYMTLLPEASDIYRFKLYDVGGNVIWSTRSEEIGSVAPSYYSAEKNSAGKIVYHREQALASDIDGLALHALSQGVAVHEVAEIFVPVITEGRVIGAMEFFTDITDVRETFLIRVRLLLSGLSMLALVTIGFVVAILYRANRGQYAALMQRSDSEKELLGEQLRLSRDVKLLGELNEWLQSSRSLDELFDMVGRFMTHILPNAEGSVYVYSNSRDVLDGWASWNGGTHKDHIHPEECWGLRRGRTYEYGTSEINFTCEHAEPHNDHPYFCFPILAHGETVGLLHLRSKEACPEKFYANRSLAQMCSEQISMAIANVRMRDELHDQSVRDPLTGLFNRRHMTEALRKAINDCERSGDTFAAIAIDVDHFKKFNDTHGHDAGDMVLRAVGGALQQDCDGDDVACRPGGEEFTVILPRCDTQKALARAEGLRCAVEKIKVRYGDKTLPRVTISVGVALYPAHGTLPQILLRTADEALYRAKDLGRNRVVIAGGMSSIDEVGEPQIPSDTPNEWACPEALDTIEDQPKAG